MGKLLLANKMIFYDLVSLRFLSFDAIGVQSYPDVRVFFCVIDGFGEFWGEGEQVRNLTVFQTIFRNLAILKDPRNVFVLGHHFHNSKHSLT